MAFFRGPTVVLLAFLFNLSCADIILPKPTGRFDTAFSTMKMVDNDRLDPLDPTPQARAIMISLFSPVPRTRSRKTCLAEYMPLATAHYEDPLYEPIGIPAGTLEQLRLQVSCNRNRHPDLTHPLVLFSPGASGRRVYYNLMAQTLASAGYYVVTMDHPYDSGVVEFPDGSLVIGQNLTMEVIPLWHRTRVEDSSFVLDQLANPRTVRQLIPGATRGLNTGRVGMYGHSLGGAAGVAGMVNDSRIVGAADLDGSLIHQRGGPYDGAVLLFGTSSHNRTSDPSWATAYPTLGDWRLELDLQGATHLTFADFAMLLHSTGVEELVPPQVLAELRGSLPGDRSFEIITTYVEAFFDFVLRHKKSPLLKMPSSKFPEVVFRP